MTALLAALLAFQEGTIVTAANESIQARDLALAVEGGELVVTYATSAGAKEKIKALEVVEISFRGAAAAPVTGPSALEVTLTSGDVLAGLAGAASEQGIQLSGKVFGSPLIQFEYIRSIVVTANAARLPKRLPEKAEVTDVIFTTNGDRALGTLLSLASTGAVFGSASLKKDITLTLPQIAGVWMGNPKPPQEPATLLATVMTTDGSSLRGQIESLSGGKLAFKDLYGNARSIAADAVAGITMKNGRVVYLSDLAPTAVEENANYISGPKKSPSDLEYPFRRDRSAAGGKLVLGTAEHRKGLGVHAHSALSFALDGGFKRFQSAVGLDRIALDHAAVTASVWIDGKEARTLTISKKDPPQALDLDVSGARELKLVVTWAGTGQSCWAGWGSARLIR